MKGSFHIADWEVQPQINCVIKGDKSLHLEPKVMQVLVQLASHPNEVLSKEQLIHLVWPDTFVSDDVLTRSISEIRRALEDDARSPRFIQTIPKVGYRLIGPVAFQTAVAEQAATSPPAAGPESVPLIPEPASATAVTAPTKPASSRKLVAFALLGLVAAVTLWWIMAHRSPTEAHYKIVPFTSNLGSETQPAFSPDGKQVAFVWNGEDGKFRHIYVKLIGTETQLQLTSGEADDYNPVWSPDDTSIAFLRSSPTDRGIYIVPAIGGAVRKIYTPEAKIDLTYEWERGALSWSPDGKRLIFVDGKSSETRSAIYSLDLATLASKPITSPPKDFDGDFSPKFSPDGKRIAFVRGTEGFVRDIYVMNADGGQPRRLTFDNRYVSSLAWTTDGSAIVFSSNRGGKDSLWRVPLKGGQPQRLPVGGEDAFSPAIAPSGDRLAYTQRFAKWSILHVSMAPRNGAKQVVTRMLSSTEQDSAPRYSPDGSKIAFQSWRTGTQEIWMCSASGSDLVKLTAFGGPITGSPSWSPDGQQIAFDSRPQGHSHVYTIDINGGMPKLVTSGDYNDILPNWSPDGQWIYFGSNRSGTWQIWKVPAKGGEPKQVTSDGGFVAMESGDGQWIYFAKGDKAGIWRMPVAGGPEQAVVKQPAIGYWGYWTLSGDNLYYLDVSGKLPQIEALNLPSRKTTNIHALQRTPPPFAGLTVSPDRKSLVYTDLIEADSHITLVENYR